MTMSNTSRPSWHNIDIGVGYQAKGVFRQPTAEKPTVFVIDSSKEVNPNINTLKRTHDAEDSIKSKQTTAESSSKDQNHSKHDKKSKHKKERKEKKVKKEKKHSKKSKKDDNKTSEENNFNPLLQLFATRISDDPRNFGV